jgi:hypothetical protein
MTQWLDCMILSNRISDCYVLHSSQRDSFLSGRDGNSRLFLSLVHGVFTPSLLMKNRSIPRMILIPKKHHVQSKYPKWDTSQHHCTDNKLNLWCMLPNAFFKFSQITAYDFWWHLASWIAYINLNWSMFLTSINTVTLNETLTCSTSKM